MNESKTCTVSHIKVDQRVFFMLDNKVHFGKIESIKIDIANDGLTLIYYTILDDETKHWERKDKLAVIHDLVALTKEELLSRL